MKLGRFIFDIAGPERRDEILALRSAVYSIELGYGSAAVEWGPVDERAFHLLALAENGEAVGTMRVLGPNARPFELETSLDIGLFLRPEHPPGELTRFCIAPPFRAVTRGLTVHMGLMRLLYDACRGKRINDVFICAKPSAQKMYEFALFEPLTPPNILYGPLAGDLHVLMRLHIPTLATRYIESNHILKRAFLDSSPAAQTGGV